MHMGSATRKPLTPTTVVIPHHQDSCHPDDKVVILTRSGRIRSWRVAHVRPTTNERVRVPQVPRFWGPGIPQTPPSQGLFPKYAPGSRIAVAPASSLTRQFPCRHPGHIQPGHDRRSRANPAKFGSCPKSRASVQKTWRLPKQWPKNASFQAKPHEVKPSPAIHNP